MQSNPFDWLPGKLVLKALAVKPANEKSRLRFCIATIDSEERRRAKQHTGTAHCCCYFFQYENQSLSLDAHSFQNSISEI